jgi:predicted metal-dependent enzyme (double-stranded beta helix superfamily)
MADSALALGAPPPVGRTRTLRRLTRLLDALVATNSDATAIAARVGMLLRPALSDPSLLEPRHCEPADDRYRQHLVHVHPGGRYSIVALVWKPGQTTPIHDHRCWCVVGVWRGLEQETTYDLHGDGAAPYLLPRRSALASPGDVSVLVPPVEDIHRVENAGTDVAISIHVYGADISALGSSINREFADELVRTPTAPRRTAPLSCHRPTGPRSHRRPLGARRSILDLLCPAESIECLVDGQEDGRLERAERTAAGNRQRHRGHRDVVGCLPQRVAVVGAERVPEPLELPADGLDVRLGGLSPVLGVADQPGPRLRRVAEPR